MENQRGRLSKAGLSLGNLLLYELSAFPSCRAGAWSSEGCTVPLCPWQCSFPTRPVLINKAQLGSTDLEQVPQGWQQPLLTHQPCSAHWRVKAGTEGWQGQHVQAARARKRQQGRVAFPPCHIPYPASPKHLDRTQRRSCRHLQQMIQLQ